jgi:hypothetical protein
MIESSRANVRSRYRILTVLGAVVAVFAVCALLRRPILREAGRLLTFSDPVAAADIIVVTEWDATDGALLDAADLVQDGIASRVAILLTPPVPADRELARRGIHREPISVYLVGMLHSLGVKTVEIIPSTADGTGAEGEVLTAWCDERQFRSVVVVSSPDHSRRVRRVLNRWMRHHPTRIAVHTARYSDFDPERWWETHNGIRWELEGMGKLIVDVALHPIS